MLVISIIFSCKSTEFIRQTDPYSGNQQPIPKESREAYRDIVVTEANKYLGAKYKYAGKGPNHFDCSGLVCTVYAASGFKLCGPSYELANKGVEVKLAQAKPGDLIFFKKDGKVFHVSIVISSETEALWVIHSTTSRGVIKENILSSVYWRSKIYKLVNVSKF